MRQRLLKKEIARHWRELEAAVAEQALPEDELAKKLLAAWDEFRLYARPPWAEQWDHGRRQVAACLAAAAKEQWQEAATLLEDVKRLTTGCHSKYKR